VLITDDGADGKASEMSRRQYCAANSESRKQLQVSNKMIVVVVVDVIVIRDEKKQLVRMVC